MITRSALGLAVSCIAMHCSTREASITALTPIAPTGPAKVAAKASVAPEDIATIPTPNVAASGFRIGAPPLRLSSDHDRRPLTAISLGGGYVAATDGATTVSIWDVSSGKLIRRIGDPDHGQGQPILVLLSDSGRLLTTSFEGKGYLLEQPFTGEPSPLPCVPYDFSSDDSRMVCFRRTPFVVDIETKKILATAPADSRNKGSAWGLSFAPGDNSINWAHKGGALRWSYASNGAVDSIFSTTHTLISAEFARRGDAALLRAGHGYYRADLRTGKVTPLPQGELAYSLLPSGDAVSVLRNDTYVALDFAAKPATTLITAPGAQGPLSFRADGRAFAFIAAVSADPAEPAYELRIVEDGRLRSYPAPTRFASWTAQSHALLTRDGHFWDLDPSSGSRTPTASPVPPTRPSWAPATFVPWPQRDGSVAYVSATRRASALPQRRRALPCEPALHRASASAAPAPFLTTPCPTDDEELQEELESNGLSHLGWFLGPGWILSATTRQLTLHDATGAVRHTAAAPRPLPDEFPTDAKFWSFAFSPDGAHLAVLWRRHDFGPDRLPEPDPRRDALHLDEARAATTCKTDAKGDCRWEYYLELWSLEPPTSPATRWPKRVWRERLTAAPRGVDISPPKTPSGPLVFSPRGDALLIAFADGDVLLRSIAHTPASDDTTPVAPLFSLSTLSITKLSISPDARWLFAEDAAAEQRLWPLPN